MPILMVLITNLFAAVLRNIKYAFAVDKGGTSMVVDKHQLKRYSITEIYEMLKK